jgi:twitching motility protein PilI
MNASNIKLLTQPQKNLGDAYLQFKLERSTTAVLPINFTEEVVVLPLRTITSIPNTSESIVGLMNWRNRIIWVVDLPKMLGFESQFSQLQQCNIIVVRHEAETIGLMVPEIKGTVRFDGANIQSAQNQANDIIPYLNGCICEKDELNLVLNIQTILESSSFNDK